MATWQNLKILTERRYGIPIKSDQFSLITPLYQSGTLMKYDIAQNVWYKLMECATKFAGGGNKDPVPYDSDIWLCQREIAF